MQSQELETMLTRLVSLSPSDRRTLVIEHVRQKYLANPAAGVRLTAAMCAALTGEPAQLDLDVVRAAGHEVEEEAPTHAEAGALAAEAGAATEEPLIEEGRTAYV